MLLNALGDSCSCPQVIRLWVAEECFLSPMLESQRKNSIFQKDIIQIPVGNLFLQPSAVFAWVFQHINCGLASSIEIIQNTSEQRFYSY